MINVRILPEDCPPSEYELGILQGLWLGGMICEEAETDRKRSSIMATKIMAYRMNRQLNRETGFNISEEV